MPIKSKEKKVSKSKALTVLRVGKKNKTYDVVVAVRGYLNKEGDWEIDWEGAHWLHDLEEEGIGKSGLPSGFPFEVGKTFMELSASESAEKSLGRFGKALGEGLIQSLAGVEIFKGGSMP